MSMRTLARNRKAGQGPRTGAGGDGGIVRGGMVRLANSRAFVSNSRIALMPRSLVGALVPRATVEGGIASLRPASSKSESYAHGFRIATFRGIDTPSPARHSRLERIHYEHNA